VRLVTRLAEQQAEFLLVIPQVMPLVKRQVIPQVMPLVKRQVMFRLVRQLVKFQLVK
jgi:hypothetical protein